MDNKERKGLKERLSSGETLVVAEGYVFEFERRGYLQAGAFVPEVVVERPDLVKNIYEEFVHAGSDVVLAFTYYGHRAKLRLIGRENELENFNRRALRLARQVADDQGALMAGNICNTSIFKPNDKDNEMEIRALFKEQIEWAVDEGADFILGETFTDYGEALIALDCIKQYGNGLPAVITIMSLPDGTLLDGPSIEETCKQLEADGAAVVGLNCSLGPKTILPLMERITKVCSGPLACLPVPYRTTPEMPNMQRLKDPESGKRCFPLNLDQWLCSRDTISEFTKELQKMGVVYMGLCCGSRAYHIRAMAEALGRTPPASKFSANMKLHLSAVPHEHVKTTFTQITGGEIMKY